MVFYVNFCFKATCQAAIHNELFLNKISKKGNSTITDRTINSRPAETQKQEKFLGSYKIIRKAGKRLPSGLCSVSILLLSGVRDIYVRHKANLNNVTAKCLKDLSPEFG